MTPGTLAALMRCLQHWEGLFQDEGIDTITSPEGEVFTIHDLTRLYERRVFLSPVHAQVIELSLYRDHEDPVVAGFLGLADPAQVGIYASEGLRQLCEMYGEVREPDGPLALMDADSGFLDLGVDYEIAVRDVRGPGGRGHGDDQPAAEGIQPLQLLSG